MFLIILMHLVFENQILIVEYIFFDVYLWSFILNKYVKEY